LTDFPTAKHAQIFPFRITPRRARSVIVHSARFSTLWQAQRAILLSLVGLSTLSIVLRVFDQAKVVGDVAGLVLRAASLASAGVSFPTAVRIQSIRSTATDSHLFRVGNLSIRGGRNC